MQRIDDEQMERVDNLRELYRKATIKRYPKLATIDTPLPTITRSKALRWALDIGLDVAEQMLKKS